MKRYAVFAILIAVMFAASLSFSGCGTVNGREAAATVTAQQVTPAADVETKASVPTTGTGVVHDTSVFGVIFTGSMDSTIDVNLPANLTGFSMVFTRTDAPGGFTIDASSAAKYGRFAWSSGALTNDTLFFVFLSNAAILANGGTLLVEGGQYTLTITLPSSLRSATGGTVSTTSGYSLVDIAFIVS